MEKLTILNQKKKKNRIVKILLLNIGICLSQFHSNAQTTLCDLVDTTSVAQAMPGQPSTCRNLLRDFIVYPNDAVVEVRLKFWVFTLKNNFNGGYWTKTGHVSTLADAQLAVDQANILLANLQAPQLTVSGVPTGTNNAKIKFVVGGFQYVDDDDAYYYNMRDSLRNWSHWPYQDPNYINIYMGGQVSGPIRSGNSDGFYKFGSSVFPAIFPFNYVVFNPQLNYFNPFNPTWDNIGIYSGTYGTMLAHEVCHVLGLHHSTGAIGVFAGDPWSNIMPDFGCCNYISALDYVRETHISADSCGQPGGSNNFMSQNGQCNRYLSPEQLAVMHFNLRTSMKDVLSSAGYTAATERNPLFDYSVTSDETWTSDRYLKGNIIVKAGKTLTIKCVVAMMKGAGVIVEKTGLLVVDGGKITNVSGRTWEGIYVAGDPSKSQAISSGMPVYQGMAKFINGAEISYAKVGVRNYLLPFNGTGGIILAGNSDFINNQVDVDFRGTNSTTGNAISAGRFFSCNFKTTGEIGDGLLPLYHANLNKSIGVQFNGCNFEYTDGMGTSYWPNVGYGINSVNSKFTVDQNGSARSAFRNLAYGIYVNNYNPLRVPYIANCDFIDNVAYGAYFMNADYLLFQNNYIKNMNGISPIAGVYLNNCKYYTLKNNSFVEDLATSGKSSPGLEIHNSGTGAHQVYRNSFSNLSVAINAMGDNSGLSNTADGLKMNCNDFTQTANLYDIALDPGANSIVPSVMRRQGDVNFPSASNTVRNMYAATCVSNNQNKWYIHSSSNKIVDHGCNATSVNGEITRPYPQPGCSRSIVNTVTISTQLNYTLHCGTGLLSGGGTSTIPSQRLANMNDYIGNLKDDEVTNGSDNHFEIQATVASKLNLFLTDTLLNDPDSVLTILENNQGAMDDWDLQSVFTSMDKADYTTALSKIGDMSDNGKTELAELLSKIITVEQDTVSGIENLDPGYYDFFHTYLEEDKQGQALAAVFLSFVTGEGYGEPHLYPEGITGDDRKMNPLSKMQSATGIDQVSIYPNPAQTGVTINFTGREAGTVLVEVRDLLGKIIYTNFIKGKFGTDYIPMNDLSSGMYLVTLSRNHEVIYKTKLIKEN